MDTYRAQVIIEQDEDGMFIADVPALPGCHTQGRTPEEALENVQDVIAMCVQEMPEQGEDTGVSLVRKIPKDKGLSPHDFQKL